MCQTFKTAPLKKEIDFADAPGETGGLWKRVGDEENALADKLEIYPEGTAVMLAMRIFRHTQKGLVQPRQNSI